METKLFHYIKAGYPVVWVRTSEDIRAVEHILASVEEAGLNGHWVGEWRVTTGLNIDGKTKPEGVTIPKAVSYLVKEAQADSKGILIIHNIRQFIGNFQVIQELKDAAMIIRTRSSYIFLVGAEIAVPPELMGLLTVFDYPLPTKEHFTKLYTELCDKYAASLTLPATKKEKKAEIEKAADAALGMTHLQGENAMALSFVKSRAVDMPVLFQEKEQAIKQSDVLELIPVTEGLDNLGGFDVFKPWVQRRASVFTPAAKEYGLRPPRGVLIAGLAGTGKSLCCKTISDYMQIPLIKFDVGKVFKSLQGASEAAVRNALRIAEAVAPAVLWVDELEKSMAGSDSSGRTDSGTTARVMSTILSWMQDKTAPIFVAATVNNIDNIPPELLRKGRFDEVWGVDLPAEEERQAIFKIHIKKRGRDPKNFDIVTLSAASNWFTGAEIEAGIEDAMYFAYADNGREFTTADIVRSLEETTPQCKTQSEKISIIRDWIADRARLVSSHTVGRWGAKASVAVEELRKLEVGDKQ